jgi:hypothetical protein
MPDPQRRAVRSRARGGVPLFLSRRVGEEHSARALPCPLYDSAGTHESVMEAQFVARQYSHRP